MTDMELAEEIERLPNMTFADGSSVRICYLEDQWGIAKQRSDVQKNISGNWRLTKKTGKQRK